MTKMPARLSAALLFAFVTLPAMAQVIAPNHALIVGRSPAIGVGAVKPSSAGQALVDQGASADPAFMPITGDCGLTSAGVLTCTKLNGVAYPASPSTNTVPVVTGSNTITYEAIPNAALGTMAAHTWKGNATGSTAAAADNAFATGCDTFLGASNSANLRACLTDEVGTGSAYFVGGALGTPASGTATNLTGLPISTGVSGLGTNVATFLATPSSANLAAAVTDETGTAGNLMFSTGPSLTASPTASDSSTLVATTAWARSATGNFGWVGGTLTPNTTYQCTGGSGANPANAILMASSGAAWGFGGLPGCISGDHQRAQFLMRSTTQTDPTIAEYFFNVEGVDKTGATGQWHTGAPYLANDFVYNGSNLYQTVAGGTAGASGPTCTVGTCSDGSVTWTYKGNSITNGKVVANISAIGGDPNTHVAGGSLWGLNINNVYWPGFFSNQPGGHGGAAYGIELDFSNEDIDCPVGNPNQCQIFGLWISGSGNSSGQRGTVGVEMSGGDIAHPLFGWGINIDTGFVSDIAINQASNALVGYNSDGTSGIADFRLRASAPYMLVASGTYSTAGIDFTGATVTNALNLKTAQKTCFNSADDCLFYDSGSTSLLFQKSGATKFSVSDTGNIAAGAISGTSGTFNLNAAGAGVPAFPAGTGLGLVGVDGASATFTVDSYANGVAGAGVVFIGRRADGTGAAPTAVQSGENIFFLGSRGYGTSGFLTASTGGIQITAAENYTNTAGGTTMSFLTTKKTTTTRQAAIAISDVGHTQTGVTAFVPAISSCGTSPSTARGTDMGGEVTEGTSATTCTITFANAFTAAPWCVVSPQAALTSFAYTISTSAISITHSSASSTKINWYCNGQ